MIGNIEPARLGSVRDRKIWLQINANAHKRIEHIDDSESISADLH